MSKNLEAGDKTKLMKMKQGRIRDIASGQKFGDRRDFWTKGVPLFPQDDGTHISCGSHPTADNDHVRAGDYGVRLLSGGQFGTISLSRSRNL
jgi:hypothetical protein